MTADNNIPKIITKLFDFINLMLNINTQDKSRKINRLNGNERILFM